MEELGFASLAIHSGQDPDPHTNAVIPPLSLSTMFQLPAVGVYKEYGYSRGNNPNRKFFEIAVASLEKAKYGLAFASGSAATGSIINIYPSGTHVVCVSEVYGGTYRYFTKVANTKGIEVTFVDLLEPEDLRKFLKPNTKLVWIETPTNPTLKLVNIQKVSQIAHEHNALLIVDNTFLSPYFQNPLRLGADVVTHSVSKYLNGHSDVVMGVAVTNNKDFYEQLKFQQINFGAIPSPFDCFMAHRGLKTLPLRMKQHEENALKIANFLELHPKVNKVFYPGLPSHPQYILAKEQQRGFGGMVSFIIQGTLENSILFLQSTKLFTLAESLGGIESLCELPSKMTHASVSLEDRLALGITDTMIRLSVGIEDGEDLIKDLEQALEKI